MFVTEKLDFSLYSINNYLQVFNGSINLFVNIDRFCVTGNIVVGAKSQYHDIKQKKKKKSLIP